MRLVLVAISTAVIGCGRGDSGDSGDSGAPQVDHSLLTSSSGEVALADGGSMAFSITSERYKPWDAARRAFPKSLITRFGQVLQPRSPSERSINSAVALLEGNAQARQAIQRAGLSVRGFVETTVALEQQMMLASTGGGLAEPMPVEETYPITMDSGYYMPVPPPVQPESIMPMPVTPAPVPYTPVPYTPVPYPVPPRDSNPGDTLFPRPTPVPAPVRVPLPAPRPDTLLPRRDMMPRDTVRPAPTPVLPPRDTSRDTSRDTLGVPPASPDSVPRA